MHGNRNKPRLPIRSEHEEQVALFKLIDLYKSRYPDLEMIAAVPNGGHRHKAVAGKMKAEGARSGYPDIIIDVARHGYHGARIELKRVDGGSGLSVNQKWWFERLEANGYCYRQALGCDDAWDFIRWYLGIQ